MEGRSQSEGCFGSQVSKLRRRRRRSREMLSSLLIGLTVCEGSVKVEVVDSPAVPDAPDGRVKAASF